MATEKEEVKSYYTPVFRASFPHLFVAQAIKKGDEPKFSVSAIFDPSKFKGKDQERWDTLMKALDDESMRLCKKKFSELPANVKRGIRKGDEKSNLEGYGEGVLFGNLTSKMRPGVVDADGTTKIGPEYNNADKVYPGCYMRAKVVVYSYSNEFGKGVMLGLNNLQWVKNGARLDNHTSAEADFAGGGDDAWLDDEDDETEF